MKENFIIAIPKIKKLIRPPALKTKKKSWTIITLSSNDEMSNVKLSTYEQIGIIEQDILYVYLLIVLRDKNLNFLISKPSSFEDIHKFLPKFTINTTQKHILQLLRKPLGGSNYKQLCNSNMKLAQCFLKWKLYIKNLGKPIIGGSSLIDFNINKNTDCVTININALYLYYLITPYRNQLTKIVDKRWARYTLLNLQERFQLTSELQKFVHEWLSHEIFPNNNAYKIKADDIIRDIKSVNIINNSDDNRWLRNNRYKISKAIKEMCKKLKNWELVDTSGRATTKIYTIQRRKFNNDDMYTK